MSEYSDGQTPGLWLRRQREAAGLTQEELAQESGLSVRAISNLERDRTRRPQAHSLGRMVAALGMADSAARDLIKRYRAGRLPSVSGPPGVADDGLALGSAAPELGPSANGSPIVPRQLPPAAATFTGRASELALLDEWLDDALRDSDQAVIIAAIELASALGDQATEARGYLMLAHIRSDPAEAIGSCQRALQLAESAGNTALMALEGHIHDSLGLIYLGFGDRRQAFASYTRAVRRFRAIGALHLGADSLERLGDCHATAGNVMAAVDAWQQALVLLDELGHPDAGQIRRKLSEHARLTGNGTRPGR